MLKYDVLMFAGNPSTTEIVVITVTAVSVLLAIGGIVLLARRFTLRGLQGEDAALLLSLLANCWTIKTRSQKQVIGRSNEKCSNCMYVWVMGAYILL